MTSDSTSHFTSSSRWNGFPSAVFSNRSTSELRDAVDTLEDLRQELAALAAGERFERQASMEGPAPRPSAGGSPAGTDERSRRRGPGCRAAPRSAESIHASEPSSAQCRSSSRMTTGQLLRQLGEVLGQMDRGALAQALRVVPEPRHVGAVAQVEPQPVADQMGLVAGRLARPEHRAEPGLQLLPDGCGRVPLLDLQAGRDRHRGAARWRRSARSAPRAPGTNTVAGRSRPASGRAPAAAGSCRHRRRR